MIRAKLENGVEITLKNGKWTCYDSHLSERLNNCHSYLKSKIDNYNTEEGSSDFIVAAKVLAQFDGDVIFAEA